MKTLRDHFVTMGIYLILSLILGCKTSEQLSSSQPSRRVFDPKSPRQPTIQGEEIDCTTGSTGGDECWEKVQFLIKKLIGNSRYEEARRILEKTLPGIPIGFHKDFFTIAGQTYALCGDREKEREFFDLSSSLATKKANYLATIIALIYSGNDREAQHAIAAITDKRKRQSLIKTIHRWFESIHLFEREREFFTALSELAIEDPYPYLFSGSASFHLGDTEMGIASIRRALELAETDEIPYLTLSNLLIERYAWQGPETVIKRFRQIAWPFALSCGYTFHLAILLQMAAHYREAEEVLLQHLNLHPFDPDLEMRIAFVSINRGDDREALPWLIRSIEKDKGHHLPYYLLGQIYRRSNQPGDEIALLKKAKINMPGDCWPSISLGNVYLHYKLIDNAATEFEDAITRCNQDLNNGWHFLSAAHHNLSQIYRRTGQTDKLQALYEN